MFAKYWNENVLIMLPKTLPTTAMIVNIFPCLWPYFTIECVWDTPPPPKFTYRGRVIALEGIFDPVYDPQ